jgi:hypothetical protein
VIGTNIHPPFIAISKTLSASFTGAAVVATVGEAIVAICKKSECIISFIFLVYTNIIRFYFELLLSNSIEQQK